MDDRTCFNCDGTGRYACEPCNFCGGSGISTKLNALFDVRFIATVAAIIALVAFAKAFHVLG